MLDIMELIIMALLELIIKFILVPTLLELTSMVINIRVIVNKLVIILVINKQLKVIMVIDTLLMVIKVIKQQ